MDFTARGYDQRLSLAFDRFPVLTEATQQLQTFSLGMQAFCPKSIKCDLRVHMITFHLQLCLLLLLPECGNARVVALINKYGSVASCR